MSQTPLFSDIRVFPAKTQGSGSFRAGGRVMVAGTVELSFRILEGSRGLFVAWPGRFGDKPGENGKKPWFSDVRIADEAVAGQLSEEIIGVYREATGNRGGRPSQPREHADQRASAPQQDRGQTSPQNDGYPF